MIRFKPRKRVRITRKHRPRRKVHFHTVNRRVAW